MASEMRCRACNAALDPMDTDGLCVGRDAIRQGEPDYGCWARFDYWATRFLPEARVYPPGVVRWETSAWAVGIDAWLEKGAP